MLSYKIATFKKVRFINLSLLPLSFLMPIWQGDDCDYFTELYSARSLKVRA